MSVTAKINGVELTEEQIRAALAAEYPEPVDGVQAEDLELFSEKTEE